MREGSQKYGLVLFIQDLPGNLTMAEIGSYSGESAEIFLQSGKVNHITCIDPWVNNYDSDDPAEQHDMISIEALFDERMNKYLNQYTKIKNYSHCAVAQIEDNSLDLVYIDGNHNYEFVKRDIELYLPKLKTNGIMAGHDYSESWTDVIHAVHDVLGKPDKTYLDGSWLKYA